MDNITKFKSIFKSPALASIARWTACVRGPLAAACVITIVNTLLSLAIPLVTKGLIDGATAAEASVLWRYGILLTLLIVFERILTVWSTTIRSRAAASLQESMQGMVTRSILGKEYASLKGFHSGELVNRLFSDVAVVKSGIISMLPSLLRTLVAFIGATVILISMDWRFVPVIIAAGLVGSVLMIVFREPMKKRHKQVQAAEDALHASTQETIENIRIVKASASEKRAADAIGVNQEKLAAEQLRNDRLSIWMNNGLGSMFDVSWLLCNLWGCVKIFQGTFTYGSLAAMIQLVGRIQSPISNAVNLISQAYGVVASAERLQEVIGLPDESDGEKLKSFDEIRLENVSFHYDDGAEEVLLDISTTIRRGDFAALTGISGGGKSSLFLLLLGIYKPTSGQVTFLSGEKSIPASHGTRGLFAYVPQGNMLFSGTLRDNLTRFTDYATEEDVMEAVHAACLDELVREIGLDAVLGERGVGLSEGQAQRVAVARALLSKAPILLLDEATSALDEETEARMLKNIGAMREKTCIIVTHRKAALSICDYTLNISKGRMTRVEGTLRA